MSNILSAKLSIEGIRPLLFHRFGMDAIPLEKQERSGVAGNDPEEWRRSYHATPEGQLYLPPTYLFGCLRDGAVYTKQKRGNLRKAVASTLQITDSLILIEERFVPTKPLLIEQGQVLSNQELPLVYIDVAGVKNPGSSARNIRYRLATAAGWRCCVNLLWDKTIVSRNEMEAICLDAGKLVGLGDGRAIGFGRFQVHSLALTDSS
jgi:hypothetical protein